MDEIINLLIAGLAYGSVYALVALGFVLIYNAVGVVNFAQGEFVMIPSFIAIVILEWLNLPSPWSFILAYIATLGVAAVFGIIFQRVAYYPLRNRSFLPVVISTIGASILLQNSSLIIFGAQPRRPSTIFALGETWDFGSIHIVPQYIVIIGATLLMVAFQYFLFERTTLGKRLQATAQDKQTARLMGIRVDRMIIYTFIYSAILGAVAGILISPLIPVTIVMGSGLALKAFCATIVGGFGSVPGAILGGLVLGLAEKFAARYVSSDYEQGFAFIILIAVLLFLPQGLFGEKIAEKA